jgi:hypothetical protein
MLAVRADAVKMWNAGGQRRNRCHADEPGLECFAQELHSDILPANGSFVKLGPSTGSYFHRMG